MFWRRSQAAISFCAPTTSRTWASVVTTILQLIISHIEITCPANFTVTLPPNSTSTIVNYNAPVVTNDCPDPAISLQLLEGPSVGGIFPEGATKVCYEAANQCGIRDTCCFTVTAQLPDPPCDVKTPIGCIRYELLSIRLDSIGQRHYRVRMTNTCSSPLQFAYIQLPNGVLAVSPKESATYTAPGGNTYQVRNPNASPFYSVRYKSVSGSLNNGKTDVFEYTLPQQSAPAYIHVEAKLVDGSSSEAYLNTFYCPEIMDQLKLRTGIASPASFSISNALLSIRPNPTSGLLFVDLHPWQGQSVQMRVLNAQGQLVLERGYAVENEEIAIEMTDQLANGLYYLVVQPMGEASTALRFVLKR